MAAGFKDKDGRHWALRIDVPMQRTIANALGVNIMAISDGELFARLGEDAVFLVDVLWILCAEQARQRNMDDMQFAMVFDGAAIESAGEGLIEAIIDFFPPRRAAALRKLQDNAKQMLETAMLAVEAHLSAASSSSPPSPASATSPDGACGISPGQPKPDSAMHGPTPPAL